MKNHLKPQKRIAAAVVAVAVETLAFLAISSGVAAAEVIIKCDADLIVSETVHAKLTFDEIWTQANSGDLVAQNELGRRYGVGNGTPKNSETSFNWYEKAAGSGLCSAQTNLAFMYLNGEGVEKNAILAQIWYTKAANQGDERAQYALGYLNILGNDVPKNGAAAEKWFLMAANRGYVSAQRALVVLYRDGDGEGGSIAKDPDKAILWFTRVRDASASGKAWKQE